MISTFGAPVGAVDGAGQCGADSPTVLPIVPGNSLVVTGSKLADQTAKLCEAQHCLVGTVW